MVTRPQATDTSRRTTDTRPQATDTSRRTTDTRPQPTAMTTIRTTDTRLQAMATMAANTDMVAMVAMANPTDMDMLHNTTEPGTMPQPMRVRESTLPQTMVMKTPFTELTTN